MGRLLSGRTGIYQVGEVIGNGGTATVREATVIESMRIARGRKVAVKELLPACANDATFVRYFYQEADVMARLHDPHIVEILDRGNDFGDGVQPFIVMERISGITLAKALERGPIAPQRAAELGLRVCEALVTMQAQDPPILHRDIKPSNVMIRDDGRVKLMDLGIAHVGFDQTVGDQVLGTPLYMSPEQMCGKPLTTASDVFALGATLFEAVTGSAPFSGKTPLALALAKGRGNFPAPRSLNPGLPRELEAIIVKAIQPDPAARYADAAAMHQALEGYLVGAAQACPAPKTHLMDGGARVRGGAERTHVLGARRAARVPRASCASRTRVLPRDGRSRAATPIAAKTQVMSAGTPAAYDARKPTQYVGADVARAWAAGGAAGESDARSEPPDDLARLLAALKRFWEACHF